MANNNTVESVWDYPRPPRLEPTPRHRRHHPRPPHPRNQPPARLLHPTRRHRHAIPHPLPAPRQLLRVQRQRHLLVHPTPQRHLTRRSLELPPALPTLRRPPQPPRLLRQPRRRVHRRRRARNSPARRLLRRLDHLPHPGPLQRPTRNHGLVTPPAQTAGVASILRLDTSPGSTM